jgi:pantoate--beta-alanine ligase
VDTITGITALRAHLARARRDGARIGFVPTMGALHEGHLRLVDVARERADRVVMSIFVNPMQFGPAEDLGRYPRDPEGDAARARGREVDVLFAPSVEEMYPRPTAVRVTAEALASRWEGAVRPGHFTGVLTVVAKLLNIVAPDVAVFGRKDLQQALLVRRMAADLDVPVEIVVAPTVRERDGLAMSSRNVYLSSANRTRALALVGALRASAAAFAAGERDAAALAAAGRAVLAREPEISVDYFEVVDGETLEPIERADAAAAAIVAARVGTTRLIDNMILGSPE